MTIHRALAELKLIDSRINKAIDSIQPTGSIQEGKLVNRYYEREVFEQEAKSKYQSVIDLINRKNKIKSAVVQANGVTEVEIAGENMTIAEAINMKMVIDFKHALIKTLKQRHDSAKGQTTRNNEEVEAKALELAKYALQKDNVKIGDDDAVAITDPYINKNKFELVDPLKVESLVEKMQEEVDNFEAEVDAVLSEINAITIIEI